ncbi:uncharacterized protein LOC105168647 [Sesamum indicum]|uniref:Uncharacterized protein LOC105168647 n=1 Tax=Sesamum indicum TaxID=4182 RepID=A0A6I9TQX4_SESIN|nr:uncharacterized protein LOC105168647 [Sesamum indicum]
MAIFDTTDDKAPCHDGYTSGFYKAKWPVMGDEVTQVNSTFLALIPKELFIGYNQQQLPPPCALKWIDECITTTSFSVGINKKPHGLFAGARGLGQGDTMSPYLFVLVMEVLSLILHQLIDQDMGFAFHWKGEPTRLFQLGFADELLLFCKVEVDLVQVLKRGLDTFGDLSGLRVSLQKSHLIISRSAHGIREHLLVVLQFQEGHLPIKYLGLPLLSSRLIKPILAKMDQRIIRKIEKRLRAFLWKRALNSGYAKRVHMGQLGTPHLPSRDVHLDGIGVRGSWGWRKLLRLRPLLRPLIDYCVGAEISFYLWQDPWHVFGPLIHRFLWGPQLTNTVIMDKGNMVMEDGHWLWHFLTNIGGTDCLLCGS